MRRSFTLIELLAVMAILVILMSLTISVMKSINLSTLNQDTKSEMVSIENLCESYYLKKGHYPGTMNDLIAFYGRDSQKFTGLTVNDSSTNFIDPFGGEYVYVYIGNINKGAFDLCSSGSDKQKNTDDDIRNF